VGSPPPPFEYLLDVSGRRSWVLSELLDDLFVHFRKPRMRLHKRIDHADSGGRLGEGELAA